MMNRGGSHHRELFKNLASGNRRSSKSPDGFNVNANHDGPEGRGVVQDLRQILEGRKRNEQRKLVPACRHGTITLPPWNKVCVVLDKRNNHATAHLDLNNFDLNKQHHSSRKRSVSRNRDPSRRSDSRRSSKSPERKRQRSSSKDRWRRRSASNSKGRKQSTSKDRLSDKHSQIKFEDTAVKETGKSTKERKKHRKHKKHKKHHKYRSSSKSRAQKAEEKKKESTNESKTNREDKGRVYCTLVMNGDSYVAGAVVLAKSLRCVTKYLICCLVTEDVSCNSRKFLSRFFDRVLLVPVLETRVQDLRSLRQKELYGHWIARSFTKWNILNPNLFSRNSKVLLLDADMVVLSNIDHLFDLKTPALTFSSPWAMPFCRAIENPYGDPLPHGSMVLADQMNEGLSGSFVGLGSMVLVRPSRHFWEAALDRLWGSTNEIYGHVHCYSGYDEQLLADLLVSLQKPAYHIHQRYNWSVGKTNWLQAGERPDVWHYYGSEKPWRHSSTVFPDFACWRQFESLVLDDLSSQEKRQWEEFKLDTRN